MSDAPSPEQPRLPQFPHHGQPRVWFLTAGCSAINVSLARQLLQHGDKVISCVQPIEFERDNVRTAEFKEFLEEAHNEDGWSSRLKVIGLDVRSIAECQSAIADAVKAWCKIDVLLCGTSEALIGTVEELAQSARTRSLVRDQFANNFFGPINIIKAVLPSMRSVKSGHIMLLTGITGHLGTPGLGMHCASQWAIEGYCDSLAYEIAPFNIRVSIVQSNFEVSVLTHKLVSVPPMACYAPPVNEAPLARGLIAGIVDRLDAVSVRTSTIDAGSDELFEEGVAAGARLRADRVTAVYSPLPRPFRENLIRETVYALLAIGGHENPPARHIVGHEGVASVKEKLRTVTEELEDFIDVSTSVDIVRES